MKKVFVYGSINYDLVIETPYIPVGGETMHGKNFFANPGGKGANQAVACSKLGGETYMLGAVGEDAFGRECVASMEGYGVNCGLVRFEKNCATGVAFILVCEGDNRIILDGGANFHCDFKALCAAVERNVGEGDIFIAQLEMPEEAVKEALKTAKRMGAVTILNPAPAKPLDAETLQNTDIIIPNESETELLTGVRLSSGESVLKAAKALCNMGVKEVVITLGSKGCAYYGGGDIQIFPAKKVKAVDTTAAGDTFIGALAGQLSMGKTIAESLDFCQLAASVTVQRMGAQVSVPTLAELSGLTGFEPIL